MLHFAVHSAEGQLPPPNKQTFVQSNQNSEKAWNGCERDVMFTTKMLIFLKAVRAISDGAVLCT